MINNQKLIIFILRCIEQFNEEYFLLLIILAHLKLIF